MMYQLEMYIDSTPRRKNPGRNWTAMPASTRATITSTMRGNSAHSSGWLTPARTSTQPGTITPKFQSAQSQAPRRSLVTGRPVRMGTA